MPGLRFNLWTRRTDFIYANDVVVKISVLDYFLEGGDMLLHVSFICYTCQVVYSHSSVYLRRKHHYM